jgi:hypothetical protein
MGAPMFHWPEPNGMPDVATAWTGTNDMMVRWAAVDGITALGNKLLVNSIESVLTSLILWKRVTSPTQSVQLLAPALLGDSVSDTTTAALTDYAKSTEVLGGKSAFIDPMLLEIGLRKLIGAIAATPEFQVR